MSHLIQEILSRPVIVISGRTSLYACRRSMDGWRRRERRMLSMLKRHEVEILLKAGHGKTEVARLTGVSLCSVKRIAQEAPVMPVNAASEPPHRQPAPP